MAEECDPEVQARHSCGLVQEVRANHADGARSQGALDLFRKRVQAALYQLLEEHADQEEFVKYFKRQWGNKLGKVFRLMVQFQLQLQFLLHCIFMLCLDSAVFVLVSCVAVACSVLLDSCGIGFAEYNLVLAVVCIHS